MARYKDANWDFPNKLTDNDHIRIALLMDLRDELKQLNKNMIQQHELLQSIRRNTAWSRKKREAE